MSALAEAAAVVRRARVRLAFARALEGVARGGLGGALAGVVAAAVSLAAGGPAPTALAILPLAGAVVGAAWALRHGPTAEQAALALDRGASTDEAFVTALTVTDAQPWVLEFTAGRALRLCGAAKVAQVLSLRVPAAAAAAAVATALLAALVFVPAAREPAREAPPDATDGGVGGSGSPAAAGGAQASGPAERVQALTSAVGRGERVESPELPKVRGDLGAVSNDDLAKLAQALDARGSEDARRALEALSRGDREGAIAALRKALGARDGGTGARAGGGGPGDVPGAAGVPARPWSGGAWPLRYDPAVRRYFEETR